MILGVRHYTIRKAADMLGVSRKTVRRHIAAGRLEVTDVNGCRMVSEPALRALLETPRPQDATQKEELCET